jgi:hypothetical protein
MPTFVLRLIAPRPNFAQTLTHSERAIMNSHAAHWRPYLERGDMIVFGPVRPAAGHAAGGDPELQNRPGAGGAGSGGADRLGTSDLAETLVQSGHRAAN